MNDARFVFWLISEGCRLGDFAINYCRLVELLSRRSRTIAGIRIDECYSPFYKTYTAMMRERA